MEIGLTGLKVGDDVIKESLNVTTGEDALVLKRLTGSDERFYKVRLTDPETGESSSSLCEVLVSDPDPIKE